MADFNQKEESERLASQFQSGGMQDLLEFFGEVIRTLRAKKLEGPVDRGTGSLDGKDLPPLPDPVQFDQAEEIVEGEQGAGLGAVEPLTDNPIPTIHVGQSESVLPPLPEFTAFSESIPVGPTNDTFDQFRGDDPLGELNLPITASTEEPPAPKQLEIPSQDLGEVLVPPIPPTAETPLRQDVLADLTPLAIPDPLVPDPAPQPAPTESGAFQHPLPPPLAQAPIPAPAPPAAPSAGGIELPELPELPTSDVPPTADFQSDEDSKVMNELAEDSLRWRDAMMDVIEMQSEFQQKHLARLYRIHSQHHQQRSYYQ